MASLNASWGGIYFISPFDIVKHKLPVKIEATEQFKLEFEMLRTSAGERSDSYFIWALVIVKQKVWSIDEALKSFVDFIKKKNNKELVTNHDNSHWFKLKPRNIRELVDSFKNQNKDKLIGFWTPENVKPEPYLKLYQESASSDFDDASSESSVDSSLSEVLDNLVSTQSMSKLPLASESSSEPTSSKDSSSSTKIPDISESMDLPKPPDISKSSDISQSMDLPTPPDIPKPPEIEKTSETPDILKPPEIQKPPDTPVEPVDIAKPPEIGDKPDIVAKPEEYKFEPGNVMKELPQQQAGLVAPPVTPSDQEATESFFDAGKDPTLDIHINPDAPLKDFLQDFNKEPNKFEF